MVVSTLTVYKLGGKPFLISLLLYPVGWLVIIITVYLAVKRFMDD